MIAQRHANWLAGLGITSTLLTGCGDPITTGIPNVLAPTDVTSDVPPAAAPSGFKRLLCGGPVKVGVVNRCWIELDDAHWGRTLWADFSAIYPPKTHWALFACGVCGRIYEGDYTVQAPGEYHIRFWFTDQNGHLRTASVMVIAA
jgi:hypothetical protein